MTAQEHLGTVTQKGQVTIPLAIRRLLNVAPYDRVIFRVSNGRVELLPAKMTLETVFGAVRPLTRPENWKRIRQQAREERVSARVKKMRGRPRGSR